MSDDVLFERRGAIAILTLNAPQTRNALSDRMVAALLDVLATVDADQTIRCAILTGAGDTFCSGGNVKEMHSGTGLYAGPPLATRRRLAEGVQRLPRVIDAMEVPIIAAVNGAAHGAGLDLAAMCDLRVASEQAIFAESFVRVGLVSGDGGAWFLPRLIGIGRAMEMTLTGEAIDASTALAYGLVNRVAAHGALLDEALRLAGLIARHPAQAVRLNRRLLRQSLGMTLDGALDVAAAYQALVIGTDEQRAAVGALLAPKR